MPYNLHEAERDVHGLLLLRACWCSSFEILRSGLLTLDAYKQGILGPAPVLSRLPWL